MYHELRTLALVALVGGSAAVLLIFYLWWRTTGVSERVAEAMALAEDGFDRLDRGDVEGARERFRRALALNRRLEMAKEGLRACRRAESGEGRHGAPSGGSDEEG